jgi:hypothetical protein
MDASANGALMPQGFPVGRIAEMAVSKGHLEKSQISPIS